MTLKSIDLLIYILCPRKLEELVQILEEAEKKDPEVKISIIVVFEHNSLLKERMLREGGLDIETIFPFINAAAGTIAACHMTIC
jgi:hypothetical protein